MPTDTGYEPDTEMMDAPAMPRPGPSGGKRKREKGKYPEAQIGKLTSLAVGQQTTAHLGSLNRGVRQTGMWTPQVKARYAYTPTSGQRSAQTLRHLAAVLHSCVDYLERQDRQVNARQDPTQQDAKQDKKSGTTAVREAEVQGMLVNERFVFATNYNASVSRLLMALEKIEDDTEADAGQAVKNLLVQDYESMDSRQAPESDTQETGRAVRRGGSEYDKRRRQRAGRKVREAYAGTRVNASAEVLKNVKSYHYAEALPRTKEGREALHSMLTADKYANTVIFLKSSGERLDGDTPESFHAEQKLMAALRHADMSAEGKISGAAIVAGTKRPCAGCALVLKRMAAAGFDISFNDRQGAYFQQAVESIAKYSPELIRDVLDVQHDGAHELAQHVGNGLANLIGQQGPMHVSYKSHVKQGEESKLQHPGFEAINSANDEGKFGFGADTEYIVTALASESESDGEEPPTGRIDAAPVDLAGISTRRPARAKNRTLEELRAEKAEKQARKDAKKKPLSETQREELVEALTEARELALERYRRLVAESAASRKRPNRKNRTHESAEKKAEKEKIPQELLPYLLDLIDTQRVSAASISKVIDCTESALSQKMRDYRIELAKVESADTENETEADTEDYC
ncbi:hypothetical protein ACFUCH_11990 [Streptomyces olivaceus]|uniref:hypothetical protein n=1 Tax=Streptomyces olivaceus TaxID=47716 RepID=UPI003638A2E1